MIDQADERTEAETRWAGSRPPADGFVPAIRFPDPADGLQQARFDTAGLDEAEARAAYLDRLDGILDTQFLAPFDAAIDAYRIGPFSVLCATATARRSARLPARIAHDRYDSIGVQYIVAGRAVGEAGGRSVESDTGDVMLLDYDQPFAITDLEPRTVVNVAVPRAMFPGRRVDPAGWHGAILAGAPATPLAAFLHQLPGVLKVMPHIAGTSLAAAFEQLLTIAVEDYDPGPTLDREARLVERATRLVDDRIGSADLDPAWLAARLGLSRSELYGAMEEFGGVARFIMHRRLARARAALEDAHDTRRIGAIAYAYGFSSEAHFSRAFRASFGVTPSEVRRAAAGQSGG